MTDIFLYQKSQEKYLETFVSCLITTLSKRPVNALPLLTKCWLIHSRLIFRVLGPIYTLISFVCRLKRKLSLAISLVLSEKQSTLLFSCRSANKVMNRKQCYGREEYCAKWKPVFNQALTIDSNNLTLKTIHFIVFMMVLWAYKL